MVSWDHIFLSLNQYYVSLRREVPSQTFGSYHAHGGITPQEQEALIVVLQLTQQIANQVKKTYFVLSSWNFCSSKFLFWTVFLPSHTS